MFIFDFCNDFITEDFDEPILYAPARVGNNHNSLKIITAFTDTDRISTHMIRLSDGMKNKEFVKGISVDIIVGMTKSSLSLKKHNDICRLMKQLNDSSGMPNVTCRYIKSGPEVHSKIYLWGKTTEGISDFDLAYCGSLNYTNNAFYKRRESVSSCNAARAYAYYNELLKDSINCLDKEATARIKEVVNSSPPDAFDDFDDIGYAEYDRQTPVDTLEVSLLMANGSGTGFGSGINWGIRPNKTKRNPNQAYIPYNHKDRKEGFFPDRLNPNDPNCPIFKVITKDYGSFHMRMAQQGNKALHSAESNAILGEWIRKRIGVPSGGYVTKEMLEKYGKTYVTFRKYQDGTYLLDF